MDSRKVARSQRTLYSLPRNQLEEEETLQLFFSSQVSQGDEERRRKRS